MNPLHRLLLTIGITLVLFGLLWNSGLTGKNVYYADRLQKSSSTDPLSARLSETSDQSNRVQSDPMDYFK